MWLCASTVVLFTIDPTTGEIKTGQPLTGYSRPNSYLVNVSAEADDPPRINYTTVAILIYDQNDRNNKPFFIRPDRDGKLFSFEEVYHAKLSFFFFDAHCLVVLMLNKKLRYREEHSASVVLSNWCTLWHFSEENLLMVNQPLLRNGPRKLPNSAK